MGLCSGQRQDQQQYSTQSTTFKQCLETSPPSSLPTPWWPSTSPRRDGTKSRTLRPRPVASPLPRLVPVPLSSTTSIVVSMLEIGTHTKISLRSSMPSSRTTTESLLMPSTPLTWTQRKLLATLSPECQSTLPVSVLDVMLMDSVSPPESSTMTPRPSLCGSMRRIRPVSSPWRREETSRESSLVLPVESRLSEIPSRPSLARTTLSPSSTDTSTLAQPILELA